MIEQHLSNMESIYPNEVEEIRQSLCVDDLISGGGTVDKTAHLKKSCKTIFGEAKFDLHKWHSNVTTLETEESDAKTTEAETIEQSFAKENLGVKPGATSLPDGCSVTAYTTDETPLPVASPKAWRSMASISSWCLTKLLGTSTRAGRVCSHKVHLSSNSGSSWLSQGIFISQASR